MSCLKCNFERDLMSHIAAAVVVDVVVDGDVADVAFSHMTTVRSILS